MEDVIAWVQLGSTLALLGVTYWYAKTTKEMAGSAKRSADASAQATAAAERSAEAARDAATVAQSQIKPEFSGRLVPALLQQGSSDHVACLKIDSTGDAVVVQRIHIRRAFRKSYEPIKGEAAISNVELKPAVPDSQLPARLHYGEHLLMTHATIQDVRDDPFTRFLIDIEYTFSEAGSAGATRQIILDVE
ncbi:hypothetical protein [Modestobacter sp. KNN46-3]|jgi:hypothetical protein|uniref:hypothetical protein n=1 Tax=Modestobacter sp. KNN46-3 TaxID=2711218 RepID=UPI0013DFFCA9|nr:hypothetical protein [Modestobacter sp. KNN46-3]